MSQKQIDKEKIRLTRELAMLESQLAAAIRGKEEKLEENKVIREEIARLEEENKGLEEETRRLDEEISALDDEFKNAQIEAGRLRREIKIDNERAEAERKKADELRNTIAKLEANLESLRREIKTEIDDRRTLEARLRKTNSHIEAMKEHRFAGVVTKQLEKQDWYVRQEEPNLDGYDDEAQATTQVENYVESDTPAAEAPPKEKTDDSDSDGIDFGVG